MFVANSEAFKVNIVQNSIPGNLYDLKREAICVVKTFRSVELIEDSSVTYGPIYLFPEHPLWHQLIVWHVILMEILLPSLIPSTSILFLSNMSFFIKFILKYLDHAGLYENQSTSSFPALKYMQRLCSSKSSL